MAGYFSYNIFKAMSSRRLVWILVCAVLPSLGQATEFGIYDARGLAMAGASVASGDNTNALFYNPALLAFYEEFEEDTQDARFLFPVIAPQLSEASGALLETTSDDLDLALTGAIQLFNTDGSTQSAAQVASISASLAEALDGIGNQDLYTDVFVGLALSEPSKRQGGGFYLGSRIVGGGRATIDPADLALLDDYREGLEFIASNGTQGTAHPELFDGAGNLINPIGSLASSAEGRGALISELGVTFSNQFSWLSRPTALGGGAKVMRLDVFDEAEAIVQGDIGFSANRVSELHVNFDFGFAMQVTERFDLGLAVKDVLPKTVTTQSDVDVKFRARPRLGLAYQLPRLQLALDVDLDQTQPLGNEAEAQFVAFGLEWTVLPSVVIRGGSRQDVLGDRGGAWSTGLGLRWRRFLMDAAYVEGDMRAAALQFGYAF